MRKLCAARHADPRGWVEQDYVPGLQPGSLYQSDAREAGNFEKRADDYWRAVTGKDQTKTFGS